MGEIIWTKEQALAINEKGQNILVAAAAGSGKTAVLVERIINKIIYEKIDIDKILVVTFTKAAASEMKGKILDAIYEKVEEMPNDMHLQRQITLLSKANICTIDSFCLEIVKNNYFEIDISPNIRIADNTEIQILKQEVIEELFENKYEEEDKDFIKIINMYTSYKGDEILKDIILNIFNFLQSMPFPEKWLEEKLQIFNVEDVSFEKTPWGEILFNRAKENLKDIIFRLKEGLDKIKYEDDIEKFTALLSEDIRKMETIYKADTWDSMYDKLKTIEPDKMPLDKRVPDEIKEKIKALRAKVRKDKANIREKILMYSSEDAIQETKQMYDILLKIKNLVLEFSKAFSKEKQNKNIMDFSDIEHFALNILTKENADGENYVSLKYKEKYEEILIDEYQDSNLVQESILTKVSKGNNIFMVGDVKQSIYKFRQARPELFLEKYESYKEKESLEKGDNLKIQLFKNFRSRENILNLTNIIFNSIMSKALGDIDYTEDEYLNLGADYVKIDEDLTAELHIIDLKEEEESIYKEEKDDDDEEDERIEDEILEAKFVAKKIKDMIDSGYVVSNKDKTTRKIKYRDIAILLRSTKNLAPIYEQEISKLNIPVFCDTSSGYLDSTEIQVIMSLLQIIDNPLNDIALVTVLRSMIGGFNDNDLIEIRVENSNKSFYESMCDYISKEEVDNSLKEKIEKFLKLINEFKACEEYMPLNEFIWKIYLDTGYYNYVSLMPNGVLRASNLKLLFEKAKQYERTSFKGLYNFINFIEKLKLSSNDMSGAKLIGENENVVRLMSIHKSKGLEFPVVFLCGTAKQFNMQDINVSSFLMHQDLGFGPKYINYEEGESYTTLARESLKIKSKNEMLSEEMRVLYVALTRAKEKLIITGLSKDYKKSMDKKEEILESYSSEEGKQIDPNIIQNFVTYLDWLELVYLKQKDELKDILEVKEHKKKELLKIFSSSKEEEINSLEAELEKVNEKDLQELKDKIDWEYGHIVPKDILTKTSVTKIKNIEKEEEEKKINYKVPAFLEESMEISAASKGSIMHLILQKLDEKKEYDKEEIKKDIDLLVLRNMITEKEKEVVDIDKIYSFTKTSIWDEMKKAKFVEKEKPFYLSKAVKDVYGDDIDENVLVQGVIDLYYITENDELVLVDYKTDKVKEEAELIERYQKQLELYKEALEKSLGKKVDRVCIYSLTLGKEVLV